MSRNTPAGRARALWRAAKRRAAAGHKKFALTPEWVEERLVAGRCEATDYPFDLSPAGSRRFARPFAPSIDRMDPSRGYTPDNCRVVALALNQACGRWGIDIILILAEGLARTAKENRAIRPRGSRRSRPL